MAGRSIKQLCGWRPDVRRSQDFAAANGSVRGVAPHLLRTAHKDVFLWLALLMVMPHWRRGSQKIGDCVSWGAELAVTCLMAIQAAKGTARWIAEAATEPIYGGCRVEALGKREDRGGDGAFGAAAAKWLRDWGVILRVDMREDTNNPEHDLRVYSGAKAKAWGRYGCGGKDDNDMLDGAARLAPVQHVVLCDDVESAAAGVSNGYPLTIASSAGFGQMVRDKHGIVRRSGSWMHQMVVLGVRWRGGEPQFRVFQSWGKSCSGPDPGIRDQAISDCSWWITAEDMEFILRTGDCWLMGDVKGLPPQRIDFAQSASRWYQPNVTESFDLAV